MYHEAQPYAPSLIRRNDESAAYRQISTDYRYNRSALRIGLKLIIYNTQLLQARRCYLYPADKLSEAETAKQLYRLIYKIERRLLIIK